MLSQLIICETALLTDKLTLLPEQIIGGAVTVPGITGVTTCMVNEFVVTTEQGACVNSAANCVVWDKVVVKVVSVDEEVVDDIQLFVEDTQFAVLTVDPVTLKVIGTPTHTVLAEATNWPTAGLTTTTLTALLKAGANAPFCTTTRNHVV